VEERRAQHTLEKASPLTIGTIRVKNESLWRTDFVHEMSGRAPCIFLVRAYASPQHLLIKFLLTFGNNVRTQQIQNFNLDMMSSGTVKVRI
jgi:hypothetical protein